MIDHNTATVVAMEKISNLKDKEIEALRGDNVCPLIQAYTYRTTDEQWRLLKLGFPDDATVDLFRHLLLHNYAMAERLERINVKNPEERARCTQDILDQLGCLSLADADDARQSRARAVKPAAVSCAKAVQNATAQAKKKKMCVQLLMEKLVSRSFNKSKVTYTIGDPEDIIKHLVEKTWAEVKGLDFNITPKMFKKLDKVIFKDLCKKWGCAEMLLVSMNLKEPK